MGVLSAGHRSAEQIPKKVPDHRQSVQASCVWQETERVWWRFGFIVCPLLSPSARPSARQASLPSPKRSKGVIMILNVSISNPQTRFWAATLTSPCMLPNASFSVFNRLFLYCICISFALQGIYKILQLEHTKNPAKIKNKMDSCFRRTEYLDIEQWYIQIRFRIACHGIKSRNISQCVAWDFQKNIPREHNLTNSAFFMCYA